MQLIATYPPRLLAIVALAGLGLGLLTRQPLVMAWSGALLLGIAGQHAAARARITRARIAGFEMLWKHSERSRQVARGETTELSAELRNRSSEVIGFSDLRAVAGDELELTIDPSAGCIPPGGALALTVTVRPRSVGAHGLQGLSLEVTHPIAPFEVPLNFANPWVFEVLPAAHAWTARSAAGGRGRRAAPARRSSSLTGDSSELRELREYRPGDPLRKVAWKSSARRGKLLVRDDEREERETLWYLLDASVELWAGALGDSPLDRAIDTVASLMARGLRAGDRVGLLVISTRRLGELAPGVGPAHLSRLLSLLTESTGVRDADRSSLDEQQLVARVLEHARVLDPAACAAHSVKHPERVAELAYQLLERAPYNAPLPLAPNARERVLRQYLAAFGMPSPSRLEPDRERTDDLLLKSMLSLAESRPSRLVIVSPLPSTALAARLKEPAGRLARRRVAVSWLPIELMSGLEVPDSPTGAVVRDALGWRSAHAARRGLLALQRIGIKLDQPRRAASHSPTAPQEPVLAADSAAPSLPAKGA